MAKLRYLLLLSAIISAESVLYLENFTETFSEWQEHSDTVKQVGKSKAILIPHKTQTFQRAILFTLLIPQPCGAGFAGIRKFTPLDLTDYKTINMKIRGQGPVTNYKFILQQSDSNLSFCFLFQAPDEFGIVRLNLGDFRPYSEGKLVENRRVDFDRSRIISIGLQTYAGKYSKVKQAGVGSLEIDWIQAE